LFVAFIMLPIALLGIPDGADLPQHLRFAEVFHKSILAGDPFPGWAPGNNYGFGSIGIRYYPPAAYYLMAFTQMLTGSWYETFALNAFFWMFLGAAGVYFFAKEWLSPWQAAWAAALYVMVPYHTAQIYQFLLYAEFAAAGVLPFCFLFATRIARGGGFLNVLLFAVAYSLLLLTHIPLTIIGSVGLAVYTLPLIDWKRPRRPVLGFAGAFALTLAATAFHWLRLVTEVNWVKHNSPQFYANNYYDYSKYFFPMFYSADQRYGVKMLWYLDITIVLSILLFLPLIVYLLWPRGKEGDKQPFADRKILYTLAATGLFSVFIMSVPSSFIWNSLSILQKTQFPWRWLALTSLIGVIAFTLGLRLLTNRCERLKKPIGYAAGLLLFAILLFDVSQSIIPAAFVPKDKFAAKIAKMESEPECACWSPIWAKQEAFAQREKLSAGARAVSAARWDGELREFTVEQGEAVDVRVASFYHPHWKAAVNGSPVEVKAADDGSLLIPVPAEKASVKLYFQEPLKLNIALVVSIATWIFLFGATFLADRKRRKIRTALLVID
jgi:hypothetical protein